MVVPSANPPAGPGRTGPDRPPRPIAVYLFVLALVALVPAFAFSAVLLQRNNEAQERVVETLITGSTRSIMQAVDREVFANISTLKVLATWPIKEAEQNAPLAFDEPNKRLFVVTRKPGKLIVLNAETGASMASFKAPEP